MASLPGQRDAMTSPRSIGTPPDPKSLLPERLRLRDYDYACAMPTDWPERIDIGPTIHDRIQEEHRARYEWARQRTQGRILDVACGAGHGSLLFSQGGHVVEIGKSEDAVVQAESRVPRGKFIACAVSPLPFEDDSFDFVVSFETIEHVEDDHGFLREARRVLHPGGVFFVSTPNRAVTSPNIARPPNPFHVREYLLPDIQALVQEAGFVETEIYYQRSRPRRLIEHIAYKMLVRLPSLDRQGTWWDRLGHGNPEVQPWHEAVTMPLLWVLACR